MDGPARRQAPGAGRRYDGVTDNQLREVLHDLLSAAPYNTRDAPVLVVADAGCDGQRPVYLLRDRPVQIVVQMPSDRVSFNLLPDNYRVGPKGGKPRTHRTRLALARPETWRDPEIDNEHTTRRHGTVRVTGWRRLYPRVWRRPAGSDHRGQLPTIARPLIRIDVDHLTSVAAPKPVCVSFSDPAPDTDTAWHAFLRHFDLEHTFR